MEPTPAAARPEPGTDAGHRPPRRRLVLAAVVTATAVISYVGANAWASHTFTDVPTSHPFHDEITWMAETGISTGYSGDTYRPGEPVTRQAMAAFMQRLFDLRDDVAVASNVATSTFSTTTYTALAGASTTVVVPPGTEAQILAELTAETACHGAATPGFCDVRIMMNGTELSPTHPEGYHYNIDSNDHGTEGVNSAEGHTITRHSAVVGPGSYTITVEARVSAASTNLTLSDWVLVGRAILEPTS